ARSYQLEELIAYFEIEGEKILQHKLQRSWKVQEIRYEYPDTTYIMNSERMGRFIFADSTYALIYYPEMKTRPNFKQLSSPTSPEMLKAFKTVVFNSGSYKWEGSRLITQADLAKVPGFEGGKQFYEVNRYSQGLEIVMYDEQYPNGESPNWVGTLRITFQLIPENK
ncbi:MAG: hypothetical protein HKM28_01070, partial [Flavobacteriaceae bacterium]|nr:hypothetical protein [Flavobacteriaceae bacterium]